MRHGQWVLVPQAIPTAHQSRDGKTVGIVQLSKPIRSVGSGRRLGTSPLHIVPVAKDTGANIRVYPETLDIFRGCICLAENQLVQVAPETLVVVGKDPENQPIKMKLLDWLQAHRSDSALIVIVPQPGQVEPLLDKADLPPGRPVDADWQPVP